MATLLKIVNFNNQKKKKKGNLGVQEPNPLRHPASARRWAHMTGGRGAENALGMANNS